MTITSQLDALREHDAFGGWELDLDEPREKPSSSRTPAWIAGGVAAAVIGVGGFFGVGALASHTKLAMVTAGNVGGGPGGPGGPAGSGGVLGTITSVNGSSLVMTTASGSTETVTTTAGTVITNAVKASLSDVKTGDHVAIAGTGTTTVAASSIIDSGARDPAPGPGGGAFPAGGGAFPAGDGAFPAGGLPGGGAFAGGGLPGGPVVLGTVTAISNGGLTITELSGAKVNVTVSPSTTVTNVQTITLAGLSAGQHVRVTGRASKGTVTATAIAVQPGADSGQTGAPGQGAPPIP